ncbi:hypothetical protein GCM10010341_85330 [Streptomyces noursei]|nr:hypothetical protein GCM10010341_85330 [Streptomyces noursei]
MRVTESYQIFKEGYLHPTVTQQHSPMPAETRLPLKEHGCSMFTRLAKRNCQRQVRGAEADTRDIHSREVYLPQVSHLRGLLLRWSLPGHPPRPISRQKVTYGSIVALVERTAGWAVPA